MERPVTVAVIGAGNRGREAYGKFIEKNQANIRAVAVADPDKVKRELFAEEHNIAEKFQYSSWEELLNEGKIADGIIIATLDKMHVEPTIKAIEKGYKILLEKPIAPNWHDTLKLAQKDREMDSQILVSHVLRYTPFYRELKRLLDNEVIGRVRFVDHVENIGYFHFAHSYIRGNWRNTETAAPIILAKSCHDMDILYWLLGKKCIHLSCHASLEYFTAENQPINAADRCLACDIEEDCPYSAKKIYLKEEEGWPVSVITSDTSYKSIIKALKDGPYGRCVFKCDNNVPEVQTIRMTMEGNLEVNFALTAFSNEITRVSTFFGTKGEIRADLESGVIKVNKFGGSSQEIKIDAGSGHNGGDEGLMHQFINLLKGEDDLDGMSTLEDSMESHIMAFSSEEARKNNKIINLDYWREQYL